MIHRMKKTIITITAAAAVLGVGACSSSDPDTPATTTTPQSATKTTPTGGAPATATGAEASTSEITPSPGWSVEPGAVTTSVGAEAGLSDAELAQWCGQAKSAMASLGTTDPQVILGLLQTDASWSESSPSEQAGVVDAVNMAARGEC